jgi:hypothetical protein
MGDRQPQKRIRRRARLAAVSVVVVVTAVSALSGLAPSLTPAAPIAVAAAPATCPPNNPSCHSRPTDNPTPPCDNFFQVCPDATPTPDVIVISPVPPDPPSPARIPAYLIGLTPSASPGASDVGGGVASLGTGSDTPPSPGAGGSGGGAQATEALKSSGLPLPFLFAMLMLASIGAGFLIYRFGPRGRSLPTVRPPTAMLFTPYGGRGRTTANLLDPDVDRPPD